MEITFLAQNYFFEPKLLFLDEITFKELSVKMMMMRTR